MNLKGYVLAELLVAGVILSMLWAGFCTGLVQAVKAEQTVRTAARLEDPLNVLWRRMEKDLRNSVVLRDYPFSGGENEMSFPVLVREQNAGGSVVPGLNRIRYYVKNGSLVRSVQKLPERLSEPVKERTVLAEAGDMRLAYSTLDEEDKIMFYKTWSKKPYYGTPKAVKIKLRGSAEKLVSLPHGKWGRLPDEGTS